MNFRPRPKRTCMIDGKKMRWSEYKQMLKQRKHSPFEDGSSPDGNHYLSKKIMMMIENITIDSTIIQIRKKMKWMMIQPKKRKKKSMMNAVQMLVTILKKRLPMPINFD